MGLSRKKALERINRLALVIEGHLRKLESGPGNDAAEHWRAEVRNWLAQCSHLIPSLGRQTGDSWRNQIERWSERLRDTDDDD